MYRLTTAVLYLGVFRDAPISCISVYIPGVGSPVARASWLLFMGLTPITDRWQGSLVGVSS